MDHVVVVGAGIGGLAASLVLSRVARQVTLVERAEHPAEVGAALALQANGMAVLAGLGLLPDVAAAGTRIDRMEVRNARGQALLTTAVPDFGDGLDHAIAIRRTDLHQPLLAAVLESTSVQTRFGCSVVSADPSGTVVISGSGDATTLHADLVVGADGSNSAVRGTGGFSSRVSTGSTYVRTIIQRPANPWFEEFWTPLGSVGHAPLGDGATYFWAAAQTAAMADALSDRNLESLIQQWQPVLPLAAELLGSVRSFDDLLVNTVRRVDCRRWFSGRLVLLGDAAHAMAPNLGQGANSALVDGVALAESLATAPSVEEGSDPLRPAPTSDCSAHPEHGRPAPTALQPQPARRHPAAGCPAHRVEPHPQTRRARYAPRPVERYSSRQIGIGARRSALTVK